MFLKSESWSHQYVFAGIADPSLIEYQFHLLIVGEIPSSMEVSIPFKSGPFSSMIYEVFPIKHADFPVHYLK